MNGAADPAGSWRRLNRKRLNGASYERPLTFWAGVAVTTAGVLLQLPMFYMGRDDHYRLAGTPVTGEMLAGMALMLAGLVATFIGLYPAAQSVPRQAGRLSVAPLDDAPIRPAHIKLLLVLSIAVTIDGMKPIALAFVATGAAAEYGLRSPVNPAAHGLPIALYPLAGITGTMLGSFIWGWLGDRIGRRASILLAAIIFIATSTCGTIASTWASPAHFGWRLLWLVGLPTGLLLMMLNRWLPESPRFLLKQGRVEEAGAVMARYGASVIERDSELAVEAEVGSRSRQLFTRPFTGLTVAMILLALGAGATQYGFQQWMPANLQRLGMSTVNASAILRNAALIGFPFSLPVALLYDRWGSKKTVLLVTVLIACSLGAFVVLGNHATASHAVLYVLLVIPIWGIGILTAVLVAYAAEVYPTVLRARGAGLSAGAAKTGGVLILALSSWPSLPHQYR